MPYRCVHCTTTYADTSKEVLSGCLCGSKFFFYIKQEKIGQITQQQEPELTLEEKEQMEEVRETLQTINQSSSLPGFDQNSGTPKQNNEP